MTKPCPDCGAVGLIWKELKQVTCTYCNGTGEMPVFPKREEINEDVDDGW